MKKININKFSKKPLEELTLEEQKQYFIYLQNQEALGELEEIDNKLSARGICFIEEGKREVQKTGKKRVKRTVEKSQDKFKVIIPKVEDKTIQF